MRVFIMLLCLTALLLSSSSYDVLAKSKHKLKRGIEFFSGLQSASDIPSISERITHSISITSKSTSPSISSASPSISSPSGSPSSESPSPMSQSVSALEDYGETQGHNNNDPEKTVLLVVLPLLVGGVIIITCYLVGDWLRRTRKGRDVAEFINH